MAELAGTLKHGIEQAVDNAITQTAKIHADNVAAIFDLIRGLISTVRKQGFNVLKRYYFCFSGKILVPAGY